MQASISTLCMFICMNDVTYNETQYDVVCKWSSKRMKKPKSAITKTCKLDYPVTFRTFEKDPNAQF